jgi:hypothetical protein
MRILLLLGCVAWVSACSSYKVRCDKHLRPINPQATPVQANPAPAKP